MAKTVMYLQEIYAVCSLVELGKLVIPSFQRGFMWSKNQIVDLLDSIYRGYPIGTILALDTDEQIAVGGEDSLFPSVAAHQGSRWYVLDGSQRLAVLYNVLYVTNGKLRFSYSLESEQFFASSGDKGSEYVDLGSLFSPDRILEVQKRIHTTEKRELYFTRLIELHNAFTGYQVPLQVVSDLSLADAITVFARLNVRGRQLSRQDVEELRKENL